ncbi:unnamed protein product [Clonostachys rhizophaga]|uniref:Uncharacterized protein n=1 Tax=Clonostachys rhizophaga TaxID=160324 RepID=A0A9N9V5M9_9HYPO|nr:unnamed protein product [Clonostachys rhizophaga]
MCRKLIFVGHCSECQEKKEPWDDLTQELSCLQAKNAGRFGACERGVYTEDHPFIGVCDECDGKDEGVGILEVDDNIFDTAAPDINFLLNPHGATERAEKPQDDKQGNKRGAPEADYTDDEDQDDGTDSAEVAQKKKQKT